MKAKLLVPRADSTVGKIYEVWEEGDWFAYLDNAGDKHTCRPDLFEVIPGEPSAEPAATTNVVIDGPGEYVTRDRLLVVIVGPSKDEDYPEHIWEDSHGECYKPDGHWLAVKGDHRYDIVRKVVQPIPAWDPMTLGPDLVGVKLPETKPSNPKDVIGSTKPPLSCIPTGPLYEVGAAMLDGSAKYGRHNWRVIGVRSSVYYDAALRHLMKWWEGEELDTDSGCHHLAHAVACCLIVRDAANLGQLTDDRPVPGGDPTAGVKELIKQIKERYPEPVPPFLASQK